MTPAAEALCQIQIAAEKLAGAASAAYWLKSYEHHGETFQLEIIAREFARLTEAVTKLDATHLAEAA